MGSKANAVEINDTDASKECREHFDHIIGQSEAMREVFRQVERISNCESTIFIQGETGTGKNLIARAIHLNSPRKNKPFISVNCGAIPENLLESELFGHVRGAFTGATSSKQGKFELADGGTIFLDEIGDMSPDLQVKVLRILEDREYEPVGGCITKKADVRVLAATHRDLDDLVQKKAFREDLFYRIFVIPIHLPPLRDRHSDIPLLLSHYLSYFNKLNGRNVSCFSKSAEAQLVNHSWKGNVRELKNLVERMVVMSDGNRIELDDLPKPFCNNVNKTVTQPVDLSESGIDLNSEVTAFEKTLILKSLEQSKWVKTKAAKLLHLNRTTLVEKIKRHNLESLKQATG